MPHAELVKALAGRYTVEEPIGAGGMATVYRAVDVRHSRPVALKVMHPEFAATIGRERFLREISVTANLAHPHILPLHDSGEAGELLYYVTPIVEGMSLRERLQREGRLPLDDVRKIGREIAAALAYAHARGIVHRDIKPENVLLSGYKGTDDNSAWSTVVADFGVAAVRDAARGDHLTRTGTSVGSAVYMSPEQALAEPVDHRTDIWALGCVVYELLAGQPPFGSDPRNALGRALSERAAPIRLAGAAGINAALTRALARDPAHRFASAADFARALEQDVRGRHIQPVTAAAALGVFALAVVLAVQLRPSTERALEFTQLTNFTDAVSAPALSPDGRTVAFLKGRGAFGNSAAATQVYVKQLPDGDAVQLTSIPNGKATPVFSPDGSRVAFTMVGGTFGWNTHAVSNNGGTVTELLPNASGLTWLDEGRVLFSERRQPNQMGIRHATLARDEVRDVYWPATEAGMAHRSAVSPDHRWVLVVEMEDGVWRACRVVPLDGSSKGRQVGPKSGQCTYAAWAPDGRWMYFTSNAGGAFHIWRQRFPDGEPEQLTTGPTEEEGIAVAPDGRSLITAAGVRLNAIWLAGEEDRQISVESYAFSPVASADGSRVYFLSRAGTAHSAYDVGNLVATSVSSGAREQVLPDYPMVHFDLSADDRLITFVSGSDEISKRGIWIAPVLRSSAPRRVFAGETDRALFDAAGNIYFLSRDGSQRFLQRLRAPEYAVSERIHPDPVTYMISVSPDGEWVVVLSPRRESGGLHQVAISARGSPARVLCSVCSGGMGPARVQGPAISWTRDCRAMLVAGQFIASAGMPGRALTISIPVRPGRALPALPDGGIKSVQDYLNLRGARIMSKANVLPGASPAQLFFYESTAIRNLYRVQLPR